MPRETIALRKFREVQKCEPAGYVMHPESPMTEYVPFGWRVYLDATAPRDRVGLAVSFAKLPSGLDTSVPGYDRAGQEVPSCVMWFGHDEVVGDAPGEGTGPWSE